MPPRAPTPPAPASPPHAIPRSVARPIAAAALFILGLLLARHLPPLPSWLWLAPAAALALTALLPSARSRPIALPCLALATVLFAAGWLTLRIHEAPRDFLARFLPPGERTLVIVEGVVATPPEVVPRARGPLALHTFGDVVARFELTVTRRIDSSGAAQPASGVLLVRVESSDLDVRAGDLVRVTGQALAVEGPLNPGEPDWRLLAAQSRRAGTLLVPNPQLIAPIDRAPTTPERLSSLLARTRSALRAHARAALDPALSDGDSGRTILSALLLGEYDADDRALTDAFTRVGLVHLLSISGLHLALLAGAAILALRATGLARTRAEAAIVIALTLLYLLVIPVRAPVLRAAIMIVALLSARAAGRRHHPLALLAWAAILCLLWRPVDLWTPGFQLSFAVVAALIAFTRPLEAAILRAPPAPDPADAPNTPHQLWRNLVVRPVRSAAVAAIVAWLVSAPIVAFHTGVLSPLAPLATILLAPIVTVLLGLGYGAIVLGALLPSVAVLAAPLLAALASILGALARATDAIPGSAMHVAPISLAGTIVSLLGIVWLLATPPRAWKSFRGVLSAWLVLGSAIACFRSPRLHPDVVLRIDMLAVGDGTCILVRSHTEAVLFDCGADRTDFGRVALPRALRALGVWRVRTIVLSHADLDHYNAIPDILRPLGVRRIVTTADALAQAERDPLGGFAATLDAARRAGVRIIPAAAGDRVEGMKFPWLQALWPPAGDATDARATDNERSLAVLSAFLSREGLRSMLLAGDIEGDAIERLLADLQRPAPGRLLPAGSRIDVIEAPHHGSARPEIIEFVRAVDPAIVLQSTGPSRVGDERWDSVREGRVWWTTATDGAAWVEVRWDGSLVTGALRAPRKFTVDRPPASPTPPPAPAPQQAPGQAQPPPAPAR